MLKGKEKVGGTKQFRWLPLMHKTLLRLPAEEAAKGNKPSNTFKTDSFAFVAKEISTLFGKKSDFGWDNNLKMITCDAKTYQEEVMDTTTGSFSKSYVDIENEPDNRDSTEFVADNRKEGVVDKGKNEVESSTTGSGISKSHKRGCAPPSDDSVLTDLSDQLKEIIVVLKEINRGPVDCTTVYFEVMAMVADGYSKDMLATAFDNLCENKKAARGFLAKNAKLRKLWMESFLFTHL
uniref:Myb/SANT-like domain-containing protein n=1 Tax=Quercus lobata TaxID=97700 RepID=A0A7N2LHS8_QUELO